jgi:hypothetical protein
MTAIRLPHGTSVRAETPTINPQVSIKAREFQATKIPTINNKIFINSP